jgi:hypothetical protein
MNYNILKTIAILSLALVLLFLTTFAKAMELEESSAYGAFIRDVVNSTTMEKKGVFCLIGNDEVAGALLYQDPKIIKIDGENKTTTDVMLSIFRKAWKGV